MANLERTMSCPPQLSVERPEERGDSRLEPGTDISLASSTSLSPVRSSCEMVRGVDMTELVRKLSSQKQTAVNTDSSENGHEEEDEENEEEELSLIHI